MYLQAAFQSDQLQVPRGSKHWIHSMGQQIQKQVNQAKTTELTGFGMGRQGRKSVHEEREGTAPSKSSVDVASLNRLGVVPESPGMTGYCRSPCEPCFGVSPKHRKYGVYIHQNNCTCTTGLLLSKESQPELKLTECFENRPFIWMSV